jgi:hypothetical protein
MNLLIQDPANAFIAFDHNHALCTRAFCLCRSRKTGRAASYYGDIRYY